jgi:hypothetical protein
MKKTTSYDRAGGRGYVPFERREERRGVEGGRGRGREGKRK